MKPIPALLAKTVLFAAAGIGLSACVAAAPEPVAYYPRTAYYAAPGYYYYQPYYYAPRYYAPRYYAPPAYNFSFSYSDRGGGYGHHHGWH